MCKSAARTKESRRETELIQAYSRGIWTENDNGQDCDYENFKKSKHKRRMKVNDIVTKRWTNLFTLKAKEAKKGELVKRSVEEYKIVPNVITL
jgi:hypothetical protein